MKDKLKTAAKAAVSVGLLGYLFHRVDISAVAERLGGISAAGYALLALLAALQAGVLLIRWLLVLRRSGQVLPLRVAVANIGMGLLFNQVMLSAVGGDAVRVLHLSRRDIGLERAFTLVLVDRLSALAGMVLLIALTLPGFFIVEGVGGSDKMATAGWALVPLAAGGVVGMIALKMFAVPPILPALGGPGRYLARMWGALRRVLEVPQAGEIPLLAVFIHSLTALNAYVIACDFGMTVSLGDCLMLVPPVFLLATLPLSIGGWGIREGGFVVAFALVGVASSDALALSVAMGLFGVAQGVLGGLAWLLAGERAGGRGQTAVVSEVSEAR